MFLKWEIKTMCVSCRRLSDKKYVGHTTRDSHITDYAQDPHKLKTEPWKETS